MQVVKTISELRAAIQKNSSIGQIIGFVPTMGNLHAGHIQLVDLAKQHAECIVVSIFVNPLQFGANEDLASYPRSLGADLAKLESAGASIVFTPSVSEVYPDFDGKNLNQTMTIEPPAIANILCGASRPGHFSGVATVVMKLFNIVKPNIAVFGQKDYQQLFIIKQMVKQFNLAITIIAAATTREADGLAMSSRNGYLSADERVNAPYLNTVLKSVKTAIINGNNDYADLEQQAAENLGKAGWSIDYISIRDAATLLAPLPSFNNQTAQLVILGAAKIGKTRLIDNLVI